MLLPTFALELTCYSCGKGAGGPKVSVLLISVTKLELSLWWYRECTFA